MLMPLTTSSTVLVELRRPIKLLSTVTVVPLPMLMPSVEATLVKLYSLFLYTLTVVPPVTEIPATALVAAEELKV